MAWVPGSRSKFGNWTSVPSLYSWNIAECDVKQQSTTNIMVCQHNENLLHLYIFMTGWHNKKAKRQNTLLWCVVIKKNLLFIIMGRGDNNIAKRQSTLLWHVKNMLLIVMAEKKEMIKLSRMSKAPTPTEKSKTQCDNTKTPPKTSITQRLQTNLGRSVNDSHPSGVVKPVYRFTTFPLTTTAV